MNPLLRMSNKMQQLQIVWRTHNSFFKLVSTLLVLVILLILRPANGFMPPNSRLQQRLSASSTAGSGIVGGDDGTAVVDELMLETYDKLASRLISRYEQGVASNSLKNNQLFVCIAGGPGSGKSTLATAIVERINKQMQNNVAENENGSAAASAVVLPMDGFHYSRSELQSMGNSPDNEYNYEELLARRGAPWTFDAEGCIDAFTKARQIGQASLPIYSRKKSDPVPDGVQLQSNTKIVLLEGNYLLAWDDERWEPLQSNNVFDETWYIACKSLEEQRERLVKRHLETWSDEKTKMWGEGAKGAGAKADANDMLNLEWIEKMSRHYADLVIESV